jgi:ribonuclease III
MPAPSSGETLVHPLLNFQNQQLLRQALTHRSYVNENPGEVDNERLEFLGDAILNFVSGDYLYRNYPDIGEDEMTRRRSALVDEKQLAEFARDAGLELKMRLGKGAIQEGGRNNLNLQSSTFEAVVGAYYLDCDRNLEDLRPIIESFFNSVVSSTVEHRSNVDPKNRFQEWVQATIGATLPTYITQRIGGSDHAPEYLARVLVNNTVYGEAKGCGKKEAEKWAAEDALSKLD